jgi:chemotaxis protein MotB
MRTERVLQVGGMADRAPVDAAHPDAAVNRRIEMLILTTKQAAAVTAMFGAPTQSEELREGVSITKPGEDALKELRSQLPKKP